MAELQNTLNESVRKLENAAAHGAIGDTLKSLGANDRTSSKCLEELSQAINQRGLFPKLVSSYARENFKDLDRNGDGYLSKSEIETVLASELFSRNLSGLEKQFLRYMSANYTDYCKSSKDQCLPDDKISLNDLSAFEKQKESGRKTATMAQRLLQAFNSQEFMQKLDGDKNGKVSGKELKAAQRDSRFSIQEKELLAFMLDRRKDIANACKDEWGWQSSITQKDARKFAEINPLPALPNLLLAGAREPVNDKKAPAYDTSKAMPDLLLEFGRTNFRALDANGNGYLKPEELRKILDSRKWSSGLSKDEKQFISELITRGEKMQRSFCDEYWYKDTKGISRDDLSAYAKQEAENRQDLPNTPGDHRCQLTIGGIKRQYDIHIPPSYDGSKPIPALYFYHYLFGTPGKMAEYSEMNKVADREGFIVVYPQAEGVVGGRLRNWNWNNKDSSRIDDMAFSTQLMDVTQEKLNIDKSRLYLAGYSNGGMMAHEIASKIPERITALAVVNGFTTGCEAKVKEGMPTLMIHGTTDKIVPYEGRSWWKVFGLPELKPFSHSTEMWKQANGVKPVSSGQLAPGVTRELFRNDKNGKEVVQITMHGFGHGWSGRSDSLDKCPCTNFSGSEVVWDFLSKQKKDK